MSKKERIQAEEVIAVSSAYVGADEEHKEYFFDEVEVKKKPVFAFFKRLFDFIASLIAIAILLVPMLIVGLIVLFSSKGGMLYFQKRVGLNGKEFRLIKFRTMVKGAEDNGATWAKENDERVTPFGRFLRKTRIDELPQLFNILVGQMSVVGPRPERECFYKEFDKYIHGFRQRYKVKPGMTGLAQVNGGYDLRPEEKIVYDIEYMQKRSIWLDIRIMFKTVGVIFTHKGAK